MPYGDIYDCSVPGDIALTYDDGPGIYTDGIVDLLNSYNAKATFFITGINNGKGAIDSTPAWTSVIQKTYASGHQIASHTWSHADLSTLTEDARRTEMVRFLSYFFFLRRSWTLTPRKNNSIKTKWPCVTSSGFSRLICVRLILRAQQLARPR